MSKIIFSITVPALGKCRKKFAPRTRVVRDRTTYTRKRKHKCGVDG